ncbi:hypothetical protein LJ739_09530 [Aestuariibacter halophilus]|uniref:Solute-binding protein family 3/N-terminal domain-containing protein n=1 Tax=Fluctibacter halophilus TaxID=226011 RepID=A0ABS8G7F5_9ALTE|nr:hypothetical protein [Aestuariibacter halophilus]MCC2616480.1 hypothetical protein [Aestuariibacter halophilus]
MISVIFASLAIARPIVVASDHWPGYSQPDEQGIYDRLLKRVFKGNRVIFLQGHYGGLSARFLDGRADILVGAYADDHPGFWRPQWHLDIQAPLMLLYDNKRHHIEAPKDLAGLVLAWYRGYDFARFIPSDVVHYPVEQGSRGLSLLSAQRIDGVLEYTNHIKPDAGFAQLQIVPERRLWLVFQPNDTGRALATQYDQAMEALYQSGELQAIYAERFAVARFPRWAQPE